MEYNNILPFKSPYTDCIIYCHDVDKEYVDSMNNIMSLHLHEVIDYIKPRLVDDNGYSITPEDNEIIKYIMYLNSLDVNYECCAAIFLKDNYYIINRDDNNRSNMIVLCFGDNVIKCEM
jgi:hypothetical protein